MIKKSAQPCTHVCAQCAPGARFRRQLRAALRASDGQSLVEFALMVPLLFLLIVNLINFGGFLYAWITIANASRAAADYATVGAASAGSPASPTTAQITTLVNSDTASLPKTVNVCVNKNTTTSPSTGTCSFTIASIPADPEGSPYVSLAIDVNYSYSPFIPLFNFPGLGISATLPPTTIQRRAVMRVAS